MNRSYLVAFGLILFSFLLIAKLFHIQFAEGDKYREIALKRNLKKDILQPSRGNIFSDDGSILATSMARYEVRWDAAVPSEEMYLKHKKGLVDGLSEILNVQKKSIWPLFVSKKMADTFYGMYISQALQRIQSIKCGRL